MHKAVAERCARLSTRVLAVSLSLVVAAPPSLAQQLPTGGSVAAGSVSIGAPHNGTLNINQSSNQAIINWNTFSVGTGNTVNFNQPSAASATLNRVTGSTPSSIAGTINAPGTVVLVNPNGIMITKSGVINAGSFVASTLGITNEDFLAGKYHFQGNGASKPVINAGRVNVSDGGFAAFLGGRVANSGVITARFGKVALGAGEVATLDLSGDGFLSVAVPSNQLQNVIDRRGKPLVSNSGKIRADGGSVYLSAATASKVLQSAVNVPGSIRANSVGTRGGKIVLSGGDGGIVNVGGRLTANGRRGGHGGSISIAGAKITVPGKITANGGKTGHGGSIAVTGAKIAIPGRIAASGRTGGRIAVTSTGTLSVAGKISARGRAGAGGRIDLAGKDIRLHGAKVDASGASGGGLVRIGGAFRGGAFDPSDPLYRAYVGRWGTLPPIAAASSVTADAGTTINVSARKTGDGGTAVVWSNERTSFAGAILGTGGGKSGAGGYAEVSGKAVLDFTGRVNLKASLGPSGTLLLDPADVTISSSPTLDVTLLGGIFSPISGVSTGNILSTALELALGLSNIIVTTTNTGIPGSGNGDITVSAPITWSNANALTLTADRNIAINSTITASNGTLVLSSNGGTVSQTAGISVSKLALTGAGATNTLTDTSNSIGTLAGNTGTVNFNNGANALTINTAGGVNGLTTTLAGGIALATSHASGITTTATTGTLNSSGAGPITLTANALTLNGAVTATGQTATIAPSTAGTPVTIASSGGYVTATSLSQITANTLVIGGANAGTIAVNQALNPTNVTNLQLVSGSGNLTQTAAITISGTSSFTTSASNATTALTNTANLLTGAVSLNTSGTSGHASLTNNRATVLGASSVGGNLMVTDRVGSLTQTGALTVGGTSS
ncbi:MAG: filamentous hemagglutinin N-terminal domain-containing protein, partial [Xanthobacteraceae bacterium]